MAKKESKSIKQLKKQVEHLSECVMDISKALDVMLDPVGIKPSIFEQRDTAAVEEENQPMAFTEEEVERANQNSADAEEAAEMLEKKKKKMKKKMKKIKC